MRSTPLVPLLAFAAALCVVELAIAAPLPVVNDLQPRSVQPGATNVELVLRGKDLGGVTQVAIPNGAGIEAKLAGEPSANQVKVTLTIAKDAAAGFRELRLIGQGGVSGPLRLRISPHPHHAETEPSAPQQPQSVQLPALIAGTLNQPGDRDVFRFDARKGQMLVFNVHGERLSPRIDPIIALHDSRGHEVAANDNHHGMDPLLVYQVPADGAYTLEVRDLEYRGGAAFDYQIEAGEIPYLQAAFPPVAQDADLRDVELIGVNIDGSRDHAAPLKKVRDGDERIEVTASGAANAVAIALVGAPVHAEVERGGSSDQPQSLPLPGAVAGRIWPAGDEDLYQFTVTAKQRYDMHVLARELGSPLDVMLTLSREGQVIERNDDGGDGFDARIVRELEPGDYIASVTDLTRSGGQAFTYGLSLTAATGPQQDFAVRFLPDTVRVHRGGQAQMWAEVNREGFKGDVRLKLLDAPPGVTLEPTTLSAETSGVFTIAAAKDAPLGAAPIRIEITGRVGRKTITRLGEPEFEQRIVEQAYVTVLEAAPFTVAPLAQAEKGRGGRGNPYRQIARLERKLNRSTPELESQQREWESRVLADAIWHVLSFEQMTATGGTKLETQKDGSILAGGENPAQSIYALTTIAPEGGLAALRLEALPDDAFPAKGPGRAANGNFVLSHLKVTAAPKDQPEQAAEVKLTDPRADFSQANWPIANALDSNPANGWATMPRFGQPNTATFKLANPIAAGSIVTITLAHESPHVQHTLGRFRLSVSADADAADQQSVPADVLAIVKTHADKRTAEEAAKLAAYYRTVAPSLSPVREALAKLRKDAPPFPPVTAKKQKTTLEVLIQRDNGFEGDVKVSLEGFVTGRGGNGQPADIGQSLDVKPITLKGKDSRGTISISAKNTSQTGTRMVILRAQSKVNGETIVNDSKPFPLTVN